MPTIPSVTSGHLEQARRKVRRQPHALELLREQDPTLADYLAERLVELERSLDDLCAPRENTRIVFQRFEDLVLICHEAQRAAYLNHTATAVPALDNPSTAPLQIHNAPFPQVTSRSDLSPV